MLGVSSLLFYAASGLLDFSLLLGTLGISYWLSLRIKPGGPKWPLVAGILLLFVSLIFFKYDEFIYDNVNALLVGVGLVALPRLSSNILPLGISFYTFQLVAYMIDIYKGRTQHASGFLQYLVFIMFFGQLIAGPIMRAKDYLTQLVEMRGATWNDFREGAFLILVGLVKKVVIADNLAKMVDGKFANVESLSQADAWVAAYLFAFQIFFDFSGYVSIALGLGRMFGINLSENFRTPYLSRGPSEFWQRWHITLSQWFRDYLYIPLGGSRKGVSREVVNLMFVMTVAGLWHGAGWPFVLWGAMHGTYLVISRFMPTQRLKALLPIPAVVYDAISVLVFFHLTVLAWIPFRAPDISTTFVLFSKAFSFDGVSSWIGQADILVMIVALFGAHIVERLVTEHSLFRLRVWPAVPSLVRGAAIVAIVMLIVLAMDDGSSSTFIYFRF